MFSLAAYFMGVKRFYLYALLAAAGMLGSEIAVATWDISRGWDFVGMLGLPVAVMLPTGAVLLTRFLRDYPVGGRSGDAA
jgi:hypothetical protein